MFIDEVLLLIVEVKEVSAAKNFIVDSMLCGRSLTQIRKISGPERDRWGTSTFICIYADALSSNITL